MLKTRKMTASEQASLSVPMTFEAGKGFVRTLSPNGMTDGFGGLPPNPIYTNYLTRDLMTANLAEEGLRRNSLIFGILTQRATALQQAPLCLYDPKDKEFSEPIEDSELGSLLDYVNPIFDFPKLICHTENYRDVGGVAYWHKVRDKYGAVAQIFPYHASQIKPVSSAGKWIDHYVYDNGSNSPFIIWPEDIISFWWPVPNFSKPWEPYSPLAALAGEIDVDNERKDAEFRALLNGATPSVIVEVGPMADNGGNGVARAPTQAQLDVLSERFAVRFGGKNKYKAMMAPPGTKAYALGFSPKELVLNIFAQIPETRSCHALHWPIQMTSLQAASASKTYKNYEEARRSAYQDSILPTWNMYARAITKAFKDESFPGKKRPLVAHFDTSSVIGLHEDDTQEIINEFMGNLLTMDEARSELDWTPLPDGDPRGKMFAYELTSSAQKGAMTEDDTQAVLEDQASLGRVKPLKR